MEEAKKLKRAEYARTLWEAIRQNRFDCQDCGKSINNRSLYRHKNSKRHKLAVKDSGVELCHAIAIEGYRQYKADL